MNSLRTMNRTLPLLLLVCLLAASGARAAQPAKDWLLDSSPFKAHVDVSADGSEIRLENGLLRIVLPRIEDRRGRLVHIEIEGIETA